MINSFQFSTFKKYPVYSVQIKHDDCLYEHLKTCIYQIKVRLLIFSNHYYFNYEIVDVRSIYKGFG